MSKYETGGYSDDLILAALCDEFGEGVACPCELVFPQRMSDNQSLKKLVELLAKTAVRDGHVRLRAKQTNKPRDVVCVELPQFCRDLRNYVEFW